MYGYGSAGAYGTQVFSTLGWTVSSAKQMEAWLLLLVWLLAVVFTVMAMMKGSDPTDADKQKKYNLYSNIALISVLFVIFLALRIATSG